MKQQIHPTWHHDCAVTCSCGNSFTIGSIHKTLQVDICNQCHPFFTGEMRFVDRQGRVDKFRKKMASAQQAKKQTPSKKKQRDDKQQEANKSYRQILREQQQELKAQKQAE